MVGCGVVVGMVVGILFCSVLGSSGCSVWLVFSSVVNVVGCGIM